MPSRDDDDIRCTQCGKNFHPSSVDEEGVCGECRRAVPADNLGIKPAEFNPGPKLPNTSAD